MPRTKTKENSPAAKVDAHVDDGTVVRKKPAKGSKKKKKAPKFSSESDKYVLYQLAVQSPEADVDFLRDEYKKLRKKRALHLREDFCGTALLSACWIADSKKNSAEGYDLDPECLQWGIDNNQKPLGKGADRLRMFEADVREPGQRKPDIRVAFNFSFNIFQDRKELVDYFRVCRESLAEGGMFGLDVHGGLEATEAMEEEKEIEEGFTYIWEQGEYSPVTGAQSCAIHFEFEDGSKMREAFTYTWRLWSMPELRDCLFEAGFTKVDCFFEGDEEDSEEGNGIFEQSDVGENCDSFISYMLASN